MNMVKRKSRLQPFGLWKHNVVRKSADSNIVRVQVPPLAPKYAGLAQW